MKLHLPKVLFTAVIAAVCCVQQALAADYSVYTTTNITDPETSEVITPQLVKGGNIRGRGDILHLAGAGA